MPLKLSLDLLMSEYNRREYLFSDPVQFVHRYNRSEDREIIALVSALFAYGSVSQILKALEQVFQPLGRFPADSIRNYTGKNYWPGFYYRFHVEEHLVVLFSVFSHILKNEGTLSNYARKMHASSNGITQFLDRFSTDLRDRGMALCKERYPGRSEELQRGIKFLFNSPARGSACKRLCMFLRWMSRKDEIDLGQWTWLSPAELIIPVDTHVGRIAYYLGLREGRENSIPSWKMAEEITANLRRLRPADPVAFDFAIARLGILDVCRKKFQESVCEKCLLVRGCRYARGN